MTCIVGLEAEGKVFIGGDSAAARGWDIFPTRLRKVFKREKFLIGYTTSFRMGQLLQCKLTVREREEDEDDLNYLVVGFVEAVRDCLKTGGFTKVKDEKEEGGEFLVGYDGRLYRIESDFQVNSSRNGLMAAGSGEAYALGNLLATGHLAPRKRIVAALRAAARFSNGVCPPFYVEVL